MNIDTKTEEIYMSIDEESVGFESSINPSLRKQTGCYYTPSSLTIPMVQDLINSLNERERKNIHKLKFLEPCVGTGNFVFAYLMIASQDLNKADIAELIANIYVCDINKDALKIYRHRLKELAKNKYDIDLPEAYFDSHIGHGLLFDVTAKKPNYISLDDVFGKGTNGSFNIVVTNPPYKNLKAELGHYDSLVAKNLDKKKYNIISDHARQLLPLSSYGTLNLYKLFTEEIIERYLSRDGHASLLVPTSILTDKSCERIRSKIVNDYHLVSVKNIPENNKYIEAQQSLSAILLSKSNKNKIPLTSIYKSYTTNPEDGVKVHIKELARPENGYAILGIGQHELEMLSRMNIHPKIKDLKFIINSRGELDLTVNKSSITSSITSHRLLRGRNIGFYRTTPSVNSEYVSDDFVNNSSKREYVHNSRLVSQQISNIGKERRLSFARVDPGYVLANSCNFIYVESNSYGIDEYYLLGLLNSRLINWYFKLYSSNNHVNNYEIDEFPVPIYGRQIPQISRLAKSMEDGYDVDDLNKIEDLISGLFNLGDTLAQSRHTHSLKNISDFEERAMRDIRTILPKIQTGDVKEIMADSQSLQATLLKYSVAINEFENLVLRGMVDKYRKLSTKKVLNHTTFKLSELDLEMIRSVPQGGNWKNIRSETVMKSQRLIRISETGGRTTLYGRLHYKKPSYTITTYFNRPGNGTYVHPRHDRVLSVREAARLQSFSDSYYFYGNKTQLLKQVGNAVPPLLAYQLGSQIRNKLGPVKSVDLFCGAGGLTAGLKESGIRTVLCTDNDLASCITIKINNPETEVVYGDIVEPSVKDEIIKKAKKYGVNLVCGGPPCQGFSMAGYRDEGDPRNQLFKEFIAIVEKVMPKIVIFENVEGILTYKNGETYNAIHQLFTELGYRTEGRLLKMDKYGVPQKRKRVIIICARDDTNIDPSELYPRESTPEDGHKVTVADSIIDLEGVFCSDDSSYYSENAPKSSDYLDMLRGVKSPKEFVDSRGYSSIVDDKN